MVQSSTEVSEAPIGHPSSEGVDWLKERAMLQRRIKHQRRELRRLNALYRGMDLLVRNRFNCEATAKSNAYRHAAQMAETFHYWPFGKRIGAYIRKWC